MPVPMLLMTGTPKRRARSFALAAGGGVALRVAGLRLVLVTMRSNAGKGEVGCEEAGEVKAPAQLSPVSLFVMGAAFCMRAEFASV